MSVSLPLRKESAISICCFEIPRTKSPRDEKVRGLWRDFSVQLWPFGHYLRPVLSDPQASSIDSDKALGILPKSYFAGRINWMFTSQRTHLFRLHEILQHYIFAIADKPSIPGDDNCAVLSIYSKRRREFGRRFSLRNALSAVIGLLDQPFLSSTNWKNFSQYIERIFFWPVDPLKTLIPRWLISRRPRNSRFEL